MAKRKYAPAEIRAEMDLWGKRLDLTKFPKKMADAARMRLKALEMYAEGIGVKEIEAKTGIRSCELISIFEKGIKRGADGEPFGYRTLIPYARGGQKSSGKIQAVMDRYEGLEQKLLDDYFSLEAGRSRKRPDKKQTHELFIDELIKRGHKLTDYPLQLSDGGLRLFSAWLDQKEIEKNLFMKRQTKDARTLDAKVGVEGRMLDPLWPYQIVELDEHKLDFIYAIEVVDKDGNEYLVPTDRVWLIAAIDIATRAIVSYRLSFETHYGSVDVMKLLEGITAPYTSKPGIRGDGMPQQVFELAKYALPDVVCMDNDISHYTDDIRDKTETYGYKIVYGPVADPIKRPHIEKFFDVYEKRYGHSVPSTTGSHVGDPIRVKAEEDAVKFRFTRDKVERLIDLAITTYNNTPHSSLNGLSPIGMMNYLLSKGFYPSRLAPEERAAFKLYYTAKATFRGSKSGGRPVYIQREGYRYSAENIMHNYNLVGTNVVLKIDEDDVTMIHAYFKDGSYIGPLYMKGKSIVSSGKISARNAKRAHEYLKEHGLPYSYGLDDVQRYIASLKKKPGTKANVRILENISLALPEAAKAEVGNVALPPKEDKQLPEITTEPSGAEKRIERDISFDERPEDIKRIERRKRYERKHTK